MRLEDIKVGTEAWVTSRNHHLKNIVHPPYGTKLVCYYKSKYEGDDNPHVTSTTKWINPITSELHAVECCGLNVSGGSNHSHLSIEQPCTSTCQCLHCSKRREN